MSPSTPPSWVILLIIEMKAISLAGLSLLKLCLPIHLGTFAEPRSSQMAAFLGMSYIAAFSTEIPCFFFWGGHKG